MLRKGFTVWICFLLAVSFFGGGLADEKESSERRQVLPTLRLHQIFVGCAAAYLVTVGDTVMMIDGGNDTDAGMDGSILLHYLADLGIDHMDAHIVTHYHNDHAMNIGILSQLYGNGQTILYGPSKELPERFLPLPHGEYRQMKDKDRIQIGPISIECLSPKSDEVLGEVNTDSLNFLMRYGEIGILFTGDYVPPKLDERHGDVLGEVDILCFPHHGLEPYQISRRTLSQTNATVVLVPAWAAAGVRRYCKTAGLNAVVHGGGSGGHVVVETDGHSIKVLTMVDPKLLNPALADEIPLALTDEEVVTWSE